MHPEVIACLRCPTCREPLEAAGRSLRCAAGHALDVARQGYVSFLVGRRTRLVGDDAAMVDARARFLAGGHFSPLAEAVAERAATSVPGLAVEVGAGTGYYLARAVDGSPSRFGLAVDLSTHAARRAARAHARVDAIVADGAGRLPVADGRAAVALNVFSPRNGPELRRILREDGILVVATPAQGHLSELRASLGLLTVAADKERRVAHALEPHFHEIERRACGWSMQLGRADAYDLAMMGPSARHLDVPALRSKLDGLREPITVTAAVDVSVWRPA